MAAAPPLILPFVLLFAYLPANVQPLLSYGCALNEVLCEDGESCYPDGLFGECSGGDSAPLVLPRPLDEIQSELLRLELTRLTSEGYDWQHARTQCVLAYFKLSIAFQLQYDSNFCAVRNPSNVWALLQLVKETLSSKNIPIVDAASDGDLPLVAVPNGALDEAALALLAQPQSFVDEKAADHVNSAEIPLTEEEENRLNGYVDDILAERNPDLSQLSDTQLERLAKYVNFLQNVLLNQQEEIEQQAGEAEEAIPLNVEDDGTLPLKKDIEHLGNQNTGLEKIEHKIVKGTPPLEKVDGSRVYLKVTKDMTDEQLYQLLRYLNLSIAAPNKLIFDQFEYAGEQLSFRVSRTSVSRSRNEKRLDSVEGIAEAVFKRRKDIETLAGVHVDETGIGSGDGSVPVERDENDGLFTPILAICAFTIVALGTVLAVHQVKQRQRYRRAAALPELAEQIEGKPSSAYQDLCRHRMSTQEPNSGSGSKNSSTSSWCEEPVTHSNMDISTGHVILTFLQEYLQNPLKIEEQWAMLMNYCNPNSSFSIAAQEQNVDKNRNMNCLPYDDTLISIQSSATDLTSSVYINASAIHDSDPRQANYIATQSPLPGTIANFWQMIWEQGAVLIVNLANEQDLNGEQCTRYWPENGSQLHGVYEIHLVSEHIWSEDYLVRSFYLKNLKTNETRTITQFHYLTWPVKGVPTSTKALLEFRRKVNKSYRGRAAPIVVHCTDGTGRTGTYCLIDMVLNRVAKGVKELNIAGSLEHLRDQRNGMVESKEQYKMVFSCLAEEVTAMVKALPR